MPDDRIEIDTASARRWSPRSFRTGRRCRSSRSSPAAGTTAPSASARTMKLRFPCAARYVAQVAKERALAPHPRRAPAGADPDAAGRGRARRRLSLALVGAVAGSPGEPSASARHTPTASASPSTLARLPQGAAGDPGRRRPRGRRPQLLPRRRARRPTTPRPARCLAALAGRIDAAQARRRLGGGPRRRRWPRPAGLGARRHRRRQPPRRRTAGSPAVIDFGSSAVGDPACDLVIAWTFRRRRQPAPPSAPPSPPIPPPGPAPAAGRSGRRSSTSPAAPRSTSPAPQAG